MIFAAPSAVPQMHSHDFLLRLTRAELDALAVSHLYTVDEPGVLSDAALTVCGAVRAGCTEWQGTVEGRVVSLSWDWAQLPDGGMHPLPAVAPRTNLRLLDAKGYDSAPGVESEALWAFIARIDWQPQAVAALDATIADPFSSCAPWAALNRH